MSNRGDSNGQEKSTGLASERRSTNQNGVVQPLLTGELHRVLSIVYHGTDCTLLFISIHCYLRKASYFIVFSLWLRCLTLRPITELTATRTFFMGPDLWFIIHFISFYITAQRYRPLQQSEVSLLFWQILEFIICKEVFENFKVLIYNF